MIDDGLNAGDRVVVNGMMTDRSWGAGEGGAVGRRQDGAFSSHSPIRINCDFAHIY